MTSGQEMGEIFSSGSGTLGDPYIPSPGSRREQVFDALKTEREANYFLWNGYITFLVDPTEEVLVLYDVADLPQASVDILARILFYLVDGARYLGYKVTMSGNIEMTLGQRV